MHCLSLFASFVARDIQILGVFVFSPGVTSIRSNYLILSGLFSMVNGDLTYQLREGTHVRGTSQLR